MTDDEIIDKILAELYEASPGAMYVADFTRRELKLGDYDYPKYVDRLDALGLATPLDPRQRMAITDLGRQVVEQGGWLTHKAKSDAEKARKEEKETLELDLARMNIEAHKIALRNEKVNNRNNAINIVIGIINLIAVVLTLLNLFQVLPTAK